MNELTLKFENNLMREEVLKNLLKMSGGSFNSVEKSGDTVFFTMKSFDYVTETSVSKVDSVVSVVSETGAYEGILDSTNPVTAEPTAPVEHFSGGGDFSGGGSGGVWDSVSDSSDSGSSDSGSSYGGSGD